MCVTAFVLGGCGRESGTSLGDMQLSITPGGEDREQSRTLSGSQAENNVSDDGSDVNDSTGNRENSQENGNTPGEDSHENAVESGSVQGTNPEGAAQSGGGETDPEKAAMIQAYITVLEDIFFDQKFPGNQDYGYQPVQEDDVATNHFAVYDIDGDGKEELIITYSTTYTAGQAELVYGYDNTLGTVKEELRAYPNLTYYDNGVVEEQMSHNHGMAADGDFWPYILYQYNKETDCYDVIASVDAWSRTYREEDYDGKPFPEDVDADGDGMVYYIMEGGTYALENPVDGAEYQLWRDSYMKGTRRIQVSYIKLTPDNIYTLR